MSASSKKKLRKEQNAAAMTEKQLAEKKEAKKLKIYTITFVTVLALIVAAALIISSVSTVQNSGILQKSVKALTIGDSTLSNAELNFFYIDQIKSDYSKWNNSYGEYTQLFVQWQYGLDITKSLKDQINPETGTSYAEYYKGLAIENAKSVYALYNLAKKAGTTLTAEQVSELDMTMEYLELYAPTENFKDATAYLRYIYGPGATLENYRNYLTVQTIATNYAEEYYNNLNITDKEIADHSSENYDAYSAFDYIVFFVDVNDFVDCDTDHTHTDAEMAAARKAAEEAAKVLVASGATGTEELDAAIAGIEAYKDNSSAKSGTRTDYTLDQVTEKQAEWLSAANRQVGDLDMLTKETTTKDANGNDVTTIDGYHIMLFMGRDDREQKLVNVRHILVSFEGGTVVDGENVYSESEKKAAYDALVAIRDEWQANGGTEEAFIALARTKSTDTGSSENGGLYENVYPGQMLEDFNGWCFAEGRQAGDYEIVETKYGYHLIYFVSHCETTYRQQLIENTLKNERYTEWYENEINSVNVEVLNTKYLSLDYVILPN